jgi:hypothetical protein
MSPDAIHAFTLTAAALRNSALGHTATFRSQPLRVVLSPIAIGLDLEPGGFRQGGKFTCRFLATSLSTPPGKGDQILIGGKSYTIQTLTEVISTPGEYVAIIAPGSTL